jgi:hypothetical protein
MFSHSNYSEHLSKSRGFIGPGYGFHAASFRNARHIDTKEDWIKASIGIVLVLIAQMITMAAMGRHAICQCGFVKLWHGVLMSSDTSQHLFDWYSFTHVLHGLIFYFLIRLMFPKLSLAYSLLVAFSVEGLWEVLENSDYAIKYYRSGAVVTDKFGDTLVNSFTDTIVIVVGFYLAYKWPVWLSTAFLVLTEILLAVFAQGNLSILLFRMLAELFALMGFGTSQYH